MLPALASFRRPLRQCHAWLLLGPGPHPIEVEYAQRGGQAIHDLLASYARVLPRLGLEHHILVVDDHSADDSAQWVERARQDFGGLNLTLHRHQVNRGLHGVLNTALGALEGLEDGDLLVTMDGDNTHNPFLLPEMLAKIEQGADIVIASRYCEQSRISGLSRLRVLLSWGAGWLYRLAWGIPGVRDYTCLFRMYRGRLINQLRGQDAPPYLRQRGSPAPASFCAAWRPLSRCAWRCP